MFQIMTVDDAHLFPYILKLVREPQRVHQAPWGARRPLCPPAGSTVPLRAGFRGLPGTDARSGS